MYLSARTFPNCSTPSSRRVQAAVTLGLCSKCSFDTTSQAQDQVQGGLFLDVVCNPSAPQGTRRARLSIGYMASVKGNIARSNRKPRPRIWEPKKKRNAR